MTKSNVAARAGAWSARHRKAAILGWLLFVVLAAGIGGALGTKIDNNGGTGESGRVDTYLRAHLPQSSSEAILIQAPSAGLAHGHAFHAAVADVVTRVSAVRYVRDVHAPGLPGSHGTISKDGRSTLVTLELEKRGNIDRVLAATAAAAQAHPSLRIEEFGDASGSKAINRTLGKDFTRAETLSLPITLAILVFAFGSLVAAGMPMRLGLTAVGATLGLIGLVSQLLPMDPAIRSVVLLIGLAVGVDYSLFYLRREREERAAGAGEQAALRTAAATSGRAVLVSGLTVVVAMAGMFFAGSKTFTSFAVGTILVVAVAVVGSLTVLPAMMSLLGARMDWTPTHRIPLLHHRRRPSRDSRLWGAVLKPVMGRPGLSAALCTIGLLAMTVPVLNMHTALPGTGSLPKSLPIMRTYERIQAAFPGGSAPAWVGIEARDVRSSGVQAGVARLIARAEHTPGLLGPITVQISADRRVETVSVPLAGKGTDARSDHALARLRARVPATIGAVPGVHAGVTGETAGTADFDSTMNSHLPIVFAFVLGMAFLLLLCTFRSIVIPIQAIALNLLSVGAAYGLLVFVFQDGHLHGLLGFQGTSEITSWLPLFLFVVLFGLSMDYHVFILTRVREAVDQGHAPREAVVRGVRSTAGVVTSAALVMVGVFSVFGTLQLIEFKQMGVGLAAAILIDATLIRGVLLPATLALLGERAWYLPRWLTWLPGRAGRSHAVRSAAERSALVPEPIGG
jgi:RND superfamily putative drug exporter